MSRLQENQHYNRLTSLMNNAVTAIKKEEFTNKRSNLFNKIVVQ